MLQAPGSFNVGLGQVSRGHHTYPPVISSLAVTTTMIQFPFVLAQGTFVLTFRGCLLGARIVAIYHLTDTRHASSPPPAA